MFIGGEIPVRATCAPFTNLFSNYRNEERGVNNLCRVTPDTAVSLYFREHEVITDQRGVVFAEYVGRTASVSPSPWYGVQLAVPGEGVIATGFFVTPSEARRLRLALSSSEMPFPEGSDIVSVNIMRMDEERGELLLKLSQTNTASGIIERIIGGRLDPISCYYTDGNDNIRSMFGRDQNPWWHWLYANYPGIHDAAPFSNHSNRCDELIEQVRSGYRQIPTNRDEPPGRIVDHISDHWLLVAGTILVSSFTAFAFGVFTPLGGLFLGLFAGGGGKAVVAMAEGTTQIGAAIAASLIIAPIGEYIRVINLRSRGLDSYGNPIVI